MKNMIYLNLMTMLLTGSLLASGYARADEVKGDNQAIQAEKQEIKQDREKLQADKQELRKDRKKLKEMRRKRKHDRKLEKTSAAPAPAASGAPVSTQ